MNFDAIVVAGGRGSRLGGRDKPLLRHRGTTLLDHALRATAAAHRIAVVGPTELNPVVSRYATEADTGQVITLTREYPAFAGPAAAVAAGARALGDGAAGEVPVPGAHSPLTLILAADLVEPAPIAAGILRYAVDHPPEAPAGTPSGAAARTAPDEDEPDGLALEEFGTAWVPVDADGRLQPLSCVIETPALLRAIDAAEKPGEGLANSSMMRLLAKVQIVRVSLDGVDYADVDTWEDADNAGIVRPPADGRAT
ncbi:NTP transferase domain-containing protein [Arthrobacter sp. JSM 101049]|uniref:NTP transferase domain-containing protein n=1 Tax=Arthrobacter sp. JSM 101049 TaxID=929097 RepID=UPI003564B6BC